MKTFKLAATAITLLFVVTMVVAQEGEEENKKPTKENTSISDVMKTAHKKPKELLKRVATGKATKDEQQQLLQLYKVLTQHKPPQGDASSWKKKTELLVEATEAVIAGKPDATKQLTSATNCKGCHSEHKPPAK